MPGNSVDVIISNCVINLSADKYKAPREALRVLKPGGRFAVSNGVTPGEISPRGREGVLLWVGYIVGALDETECRDKLAAAGFEQIDMEPTPVWRRGCSRHLDGQRSRCEHSPLRTSMGSFFSAFLRAVKLSMTVQAVAMERSGGAFVLPITAWTDSITPGSHTSPGRRLVCPIESSSD